MPKLVIEGGHTLTGSLQVGGAKNAALPALAATILSGKRIVLDNLPEVSDVVSFLDLLAFLGAEITPANRNRLELSTASVTSSETPYDIVRRMRAAFLVLGPLVGRFGHARISRPGGCAIGTRPIDLHLQALETLGARVSLDGGIIDVAARGGLRGERIVFTTPSVGATHTAMMAAVCVRGESEIVNAAREPEIVDLAAFLRAMGATIEGDGTHRIRIEGGNTWSDAEHTIIPDRIEAGSNLMAAAISGSRLEVIGARLEHLGAVCQLLARAGVTVVPSDRGLVVEPAGRLVSVDAATDAYPSFPTDLQAQFMALMCVADGVSVIRERVFEARFMHVPELQRLGADIRHEGATAVVRGVAKLHGAEVMATDLRASFSLVLAALVARGTTTIDNIHHLDRGFEDIDGKLRRCGARLERIS